MEIAILALLIINLVLLISNTSLPKYKIDYHHITWRAHINAEGESLKLYLAEVNSLKRENIKKISSHPELEATFNKYFYANQLANASLEVFLDNPGNQKALSLYADFQRQHQEAYNKLCSSI